MRKGFTLVEAIITIAIIGLLALTAVTALSAGRQRSRDAKRVAAIDQINKALEVYYLQNGIYPTTINPGQNLSAGSTVYLSPVPSNPTPRNDGSCTTNDFTYSVKGGNSDYNLVFCLGTASGRFSSGLNACSAAGCNNYQPNTVSSLLVWYRADWLNLNDGDGVASWPDLSGNNNTATAASAALRPTFVTNALNGKPAVRFDGTDDLLSLTSAVTTVRTVFIVMKWDWQDKDYAPILGSTSVHDFHGQTETPNESDTVFSTWTNDYLEYGTAWVNGTSTGPAAVTKNRSAFKLLEFQTQTGQNVQFNNISNDRGWTGRNIHGDVAELMVFSTNLSTADRQKLQRYIRDKYGLTISGI